MGGFDCFYIDEPDLIFGFQGEDKDPRLGLKRYGPWFSPEEPGPSPTQVRVGIIGSGTTLTFTKRILKLLSREIRSEEPNRWLHPDYPGFSLETPVSSELVAAERWNESITETEITQVIGIAHVNRRIAAASELFHKKLRSIGLESDTPDVVVCALPWVIEQYCGISRHTRGAKRPRFTPEERAVAKLKAQDQRFLEEWDLKFTSSTPEQGESDLRQDTDKMAFDLHDSLKGKAMQVGIPLQILRESTAREILGTGGSGSRRTEPPADFAWNFSTGLYYKALGRPWRLAKLMPGTCYVGVAFYKRRRDPANNVETAMAQVFTHTGEGFVLRGGDVVVDEKTKEPHLSLSDAERLVRDILGKYILKVGSTPTRLVIHKTSDFDVDEIRGFQKAIGKSVPTDFVAIRRSTPLRFLRVGQYPVVRGTVIMLTEREYLLYTGGYTPRIRTYPGHRIPKPLYLVHHGDSDAELVCTEILALTKLNWNTTRFSTYQPITLAFASRVGSTLSELPEDHLIQDHYRFYM